jgi:hypothetical protein
MHSNHVYCEAMNPRLGEGCDEGNFSGYVNRHGWARAVRIVFARSIGAIHDPYGPKCAGINRRGIENERTIELRNNKYAWVFIVAWLDAILRHRAP